MKNIYSGSSVIDQIYCGEDRIKNVYLGNTLIWTLDADEPTVLVGDWYVSPSGDNANDGKTRNTAFQTINYAIDKANSGDTIVVLSGTYEIPTTLNTGTKNLKIIGEGWDKTIVQPTSGTKIRIFELNGGGKLEGMRITGGISNTDGSGVLVKDGTVSWCKIVNNNASGNNLIGIGISFSGGKGQVDHCIIADQVVGNVNCCGCGIGANNPIGDILVDTCLIYGNKTPTSTGHGAAVDIIDSDYTTTIRNCTITGNQSQLYAAVYNQGCTKKIVLINDIIVNNKLNDGTEANISTKNGTGQDTTNSKNCFFGLQTEAATIPNSLYGDPLFVNVAHHDYHVKPNSYVLGHGSTYSGIGDTLDGFSFLNPPAIGCYELNIVPRVKITDVGEEDGEVEITVDKEGVCMYYTTDGSVPTSASSVYTQKFTVSGTTKINILVHDTENDVWGDLYTTWYVTPQNSASDNVTKINSCIEDTSEIVFLSSGEFRIDKQLLVNNGKQLIGQGWENTIIKQTVTTASTTVRTRVAMVDAGSSIIGVTITGGKLGEDGSTEYGDNCGGGLRVNNGTVSYCYIVDNEATAKRSDGGGISINQGTIDHCIISNNRVPGTWSSGGGGIKYHSSGKLEENGPLSIDDCLIVNNSTGCAENFVGGGGVCLQNVQYPITIRNTTIANNHATSGHGGGIVYHSNGRNISYLSLTNTIIVDNTSAIGTDSALDNGNVKLSINNGTTWETVSANCSNNVLGNGTDALGANSIGAQSGTDLFVNVSNDNYHLKASAQAKGAGVTYPGIGNDLSDNEFFNPPSIGCYEYSLYEQFAVGWNALHLGITPLDIINDGELVYAYTAKSSEITVNEVTFSPWGSLTGNPNVSVTGPGSDWLVHTIGGVNFNPSDIGLSDPDYIELLKNCHYYIATGIFTITLNNLTIGNQYLVQTIHHCHNGNPHLKIVGSDPVVEVMSWSSNPNKPWDCGGSLVNRFTATQETLTFQIECYNDSPFVLNAIQVRDIGNGTIPKYKVSWTGGKNMTVQVTCDGELITNDTYIESGKLVEFTATPAQDHTSLVPDGWTLNQDGSVSRTYTITNSKLTVNVPSAITSQWDVEYGQFERRLCITPNYDKSELTNFPIAVRLSSGIPGFSYSECDPDNMVFVDNLGNLLPYEVATWNPSGESIVWVKTDKLNTSTIVYMYYSGLSYETNDPKSVWDSQKFVGVWHMEEESGTTGTIPAGTTGPKLADATGNGLDATVMSYNNGRYLGTDPAPIGNARISATSSDIKGYMSIPNYDSFGLGGVFTVSIWTYMSATKNYGRIMSRKDAYGDANGWEIEMAAGNTNKVNIRGASGFSGTAFTLNRSLLNVWSHLVFVFNTTQTTAYQDGVNVGEVIIPVAATDNGKPLCIGENSNGTEPANWIGSFDEARLYRGVMTDDWIYAEYKQGDPSFLTYSYDDPEV